MFVPETMQGDNLVPLIAGSGTWRARPESSEWTKRQDQVGQGVGDSVSIVVDGWKLVHNTDPAYEGMPGFELYDHRRGPPDLRDVAADHPERVERLAARLSDWRAMATERALHSDDASLEGASAEELERLRSLGYIQ